MIIRKSDVVSAGKITGIIPAGFGLIAGVPVFLFGSLLDGMTGMMAGQHGGPAGCIGGIGGIGAGIFMPLPYGILGFASALICALVYNLASGVAGGIRIEAE